MKEELFLHTGIKSFRDDIQSQEALIVRDLEDHICLWNRGAESLYGWTAAEVLGKNCYSILPAGNAENLRQQARQLAETGEWLGSLDHTTKDKRKITVQSHWKIQRDENGRPTSVLITNRDITEMKLMEGEILRAERIATVGVLASSVAHDLNAVLSTMLISMRRLIDDHRELGDQYGLESWHSSAEHAAKLIAQLLSLARDGVEEPKPVDIRHVIQDIAKILQATIPESIRLTTEIAPHLPRVNGNGTHLYQMLLNICINARDAMPDGGMLNITAGTVSLHRRAGDQATNRQGESYVRICVVDTGFGVPNEIANKIFDPFFTTKEAGKGTGLGLFSATKIARDHGGFIEMKSQSNRGTEFRIYIPVGFV